MAVSYTHLDVYKRQAAVNVTYDVLKARLRSAYKAGESSALEVLLGSGDYASFLTRLELLNDFRGVNPNAFDGRGNYALGIKEQLIFPEIEYDKVDKVRGMDVIFVTTAKTDEEARELLTQFNMPFTK